MDGGRQEEMEKRANKLHTNSFNTCLSERETERQRIDTHSIIRKSGGMSWAYPLDNPRMTGHAPRYNGSAVMPGQKTEQARKHERYKRKTMRDTRARQLSERNEDARALHILFVSEYNWVRQ
jgi:hypothetical protein